jgi:DNA repair ATPase RecN
MTPIHRDLAEYDALVESVQQAKTLLERADLDRIRLINERVKLIRRCESLQQQVEGLQTSLEEVRIGTEKLAAERDHLRMQLDRANQRLKTFALAAEAQKKN